MSDHSNSSEQLRPHPFHRNRSAHVPDDYLAVGRIVGAHGLRGEVKVELHTDFPERYAPGERFLVGDRLDEMTVETVRPHKGHLLVGLQGVTTRNGALALQGSWLFVAEEEAMALEEDTYWIHDIIGLAVHDEDGQRLGTVVDVLSTGANDVYVVQTDGTINRGRELLLPAIADVVRQVDLETGRMTVRLLPGL